MKKEQLIFLFIEKVYFYSVAYGIIKYVFHLTSLNIYIVTYFVSVKRHNRSFQF